MPIFLIAQTAPPSATPQLLLMVAVFGAFWLFFFRPQRARMKKQREMIAHLQLGDTVRTAGGIIGKIRRLDDNEVVLEIESGQMRVVRRFITEKFSEG